MSMTNAPKTMTNDQIAAAFRRASDVVNGFKSVRDQQARDAVALVGVIAERDAQIKSLQAALGGPLGNLFRR